jgi:drug/metabolite transporter (DMT)-like permease
MLVLATACWASGFLLIKSIPLAQRLLVPEAEEWLVANLMMSLRFALAALLMALLCGRDCWKICRNEVKLGLGLGLTAGLGMFMQTLSLHYTLASTAAFLTQFYVLLIPLVLALHTRRWPHGLVWLSCLLVLTGMSILCEIDWRDFRLGKGEWLNLLGSVFFTAQILWLDRKEFAHCQMSRVTLVLFASVAAGFAVPTFWLAETPGKIVDLLSSPGVLGLYGLLAVFPSLLGFYWMNNWQPRIPPTQAGLIYCAEPVFTTLLALVFPEILGKLVGFHYANEQAGPSLLVGGALILLANLAIQWAPTK